MVRLYLDACIINRLTDDHSQARVYQEAEAIEAILNRIASGAVEFAASSVLRDELRRNPNMDRRLDALGLLSYAGSLFEPDRSTQDRAILLERAGYGGFDSLHLACAEKLRVDALLTVDDRFCRLADRASGNPSILVMNPLHWCRKAGLL